MTYALAAPVDRCPCWSPHPWTVPASYACQRYRWTSVILSGDHVLPPTYCYIKRLSSSITKLLYYYYFMSNVITCIKTVLFNTQYMSISLYLYYTYLFTPLYHIISSTGSTLPPYTILFIIIYNSISCPPYYYLLLLYPINISFTSYYTH